MIWRNFTFKFIRTYLQSENIIYEQGKHIDRRIDIADPHSDIGLLI